ncbi:hypothetical protein TNCV_1531511 [Trichonephila clavipes]|nr:hypothetical protein TNCV_1531511 [Trichonephila clavipes]
MSPVKNCPDCIKYKASNQKPSGLLQTPVPAQRFETLAIDLFGPLPESKDELKAFGSRINECDDNKSRIRVLKTQVLQYETRLTEIFSELSTHESDESFDIYMKYKDILFNWVVDLEEKSQVEEVNSSIHVKSSVVNLPKLEVPHFYGNYENWISFKELFKSSILDDKSISDLEKLQYLQASVRGDAAKLIRGFAITVDNLKNCWDIL